MPVSVGFGKAGWGVLVVLLSQPTKDDVFDRTGSGNVG
jgi:hypothetical protein